MNNRLVISGVLLTSMLMAGCATKNPPSNQPVNNTVNPPVNNSVVSGNLRVCPDELIINTMPTFVEDGSPTQPPSEGYYILNGKRRELAEFDTAWVAAHCKVPEQEVQ